MTSITLKCEKCGSTLKLEGLDKLSNYYITHYGHIDKATGRIFEMECQLCQGTMKMTLQSDKK